MKLTITKKKSMNLGMDMEYNTGSMELIMKANGTTTKLKDRGLLYMQKETYTEENSRMIWQMDMENTFI